MPARLLLVRHAESAWNATGRWQGWADPPLSELGEAQAAEAARALAELRMTGVVSSDLRRARRTAEILTEPLGLGPVATDASLREYDVGEFTGLTREEIELRWPGLVGDWREGRVPALPGGETRRSFDARVLAGVAALGRWPELGDRPLVVTHGGVLRALDRRCGIDPPARADNLAGRWFEVDGDGRLVPGERVVLVAI